LINIYPANRLENLVYLLDRVMQTGTNDNILKEEVILVQSKGMQHWLNLKLAQNRGISMNLSFSLPMQFFWQQIRLILGKNKVPLSSTYTREVLSWRIHDLLASEAVINNELCQDATHYWLSTNGHVNESKRFQLACQLADLFEQYLIYRPDWIMAWDKHEQPAEQKKQPLIFAWQAIIWQLLVAQDKYHPVYLLYQAMAALKTKKFPLVERISLFGINTLPPLWLDFLSQLGEYSQVHFFHLNPCVEYWQDIKTDKVQAKEQFERWLKSADMAVKQNIESDALLATTNPLLANLGTQGKDFLFLLQEYTSIEIPIYESAEQLAKEKGHQVSVLEQIQSDILQLEDRRDSESKFVELWHDDSITLVSAHSALREVQALHDWLLHQINDQDNDLTPKDILVMCPNVEHYAAYIEAVFAHGWSDYSEQAPPLPCSIADRTLKDSEPLVQAFINLLELPDSRFQVSHIMAYLRLPAIQEKFSFAQDELIILEQWLNHAAIHWGIDGAHKKQLVQQGYSAGVDEGKDFSADEFNNQFTWQLGLERLLLGFAYSDEKLIYNNKLLLADVEGDDALLLGRYFELLEQLQYYAQSLQTERSPEAWQEFLLQAKDSLFASLAEDSNAQYIIEQAIDELGEYTTNADYKKKLPLSIIRDFLLQHFSQVEPGRQFMTGQVTFCSMMPMRSVPFRIIAILGLNDGDFPRQRQPMGFDLMALNSARKGDRSRRGDDRYLFLEALISCREKLYLSYQGHDIKSNHKREPSLVLQELINYLEQGFGWDLSDANDDNSQLINIAMQAFSQQNYHSSAVKKIISFNGNWLKLSKPGVVRNNLPTVEMPDLSQPEVFTLQLEQLVQFFDNPAKQFAQQRLGLYFPEHQDFLIEDTEPFVSDHLDRYLIQDEIIKTVLFSKNKLSEVISAFQLSGELPDTPRAALELEQWQEQALNFAQQIEIQISQNSINKQPVSFDINSVRLEGQLPVLGEQLFYWRLATPKGKDDIRLWIHHLMAQCCLGPCTTRGLFRGKDEQSILSISFQPIDNAAQYLSELITCWLEGMRSPLLVNAAVGQQHCLIKQGKKTQAMTTAVNNAVFSTLWHDSYYSKGLVSEPYINWFWGDGKQLPDWQNHWQARIEKIYQPLYEHRQEVEIND